MTGLDPLAVVVFPTKYALRSDESGGVHVTDL